MLTAVTQRGTSPFTAVQSADFVTDIDVLNCPLTLEHPEAAFYEMASQYELGEDS